MKATCLAVGLLLSLGANSAHAGQSLGFSLGTPLGGVLGNALGTGLGSALGLSLGSTLPIGNPAVLMVAAASLVLGIRIVRRNQKR